MLESSRISSIKSFFGHLWTQNAIFARLMFIIKQCKKKKVILHQWPLVTLGWDKHRLMWINVIYMHLYTVFFFFVCVSRYPHTDFSGHRGSHDHATGASGGSQWPRLSVLPVAPAARAGAQRIQRRTAARRALSRAVRRSADSSLPSFEIIADEHSEPIDSSPPFSNYCAHSSFSQTLRRRESWSRPRSSSSRSQRRSWPSTKPRRRRRLCSFL